MQIEVKQNGMLRNKVAARQAQIGPGEVAGNLLLTKFLLTCFM